METPAIDLEFQSVPRHHLSNNAVAVYCGSSTGRQEAFSAAARSLGLALAAAGRPLVYGGGSKGIMGVISNAALEGGGKVIGVIPRVMLDQDGGQGESATFRPDDGHRKPIETIPVGSMHERKVEMAKRAKGFVGLPGGFGTFEELLEVITWSQLGIHDKPVVLLNVLSFWEPLRTLIRRSTEEGFIKPASEGLVIFLDGPAEHKDHLTFNWGKATIEALDSWQTGQIEPLFRWPDRMDRT